MTTVLVVEDDEATARLVEATMRADGFEVVVTASGSDAIRLCREVSFDVVFLDFELPGINGQEACRQIREFSDVYIVMLTGRGDETDKVMSLTLGADDYITKPFSTRELAARARVLLRRPRRGADAAEVDVRSRITVKLDSQRREAIFDGIPVRLTQTEFDIVLTLDESAPNPVTRRELLGKVWNNPNASSDHVVDVHLSNLRRKIRAAGAREEIIQNNRSAGYSLRRD